MSQNKRQSCVAGRAFLLTIVSVAMLVAACSASDSPATPTALSPALASVAANATFALEVPTSFPTSANRLSQAQSERLTPNIVNLTYTSAETTVVGGTPRASAVLFITESGGKMAQPATGAGRLVSKDASGYELLEGPDKQPGVSSYNASGNGRTIIMIFQGEKPTDQGVEKLLASLQVVK